MSFEGKSLPPIASTTQTKPWSNVLDHVGCISLLNSNISWLSAHSLVVKLNSGWLNTSERIAGAFGRASPQEASHGMELCKKLAKWRLHREKIRLQGVQCGASIMSNVGKTIMNHPCGNGNHTVCHTTYKNGDDWGMVQCRWHCFTHITWIHLGMEPTIGWSVPYLENSTVELGFWVWCNGLTATSWDMGTINRFI